jgi:hypothetical protein
LHSYFEKAINTPSGRKLRDFYSQTDKQVRDIHAEARRLADLKAGKTEEKKAEGESSAPATESTPDAAPAPGVEPQATQAAPATTEKA